MNKIIIMMMIVITVIVIIIILIIIVIIIMNNFALFSINFKHRLKITISNYSDLNI